MSLRKRKPAYRDLDGVPFFEGWTPEELSRLDRVADRVAYAIGEQLIIEGSTGLEFLVILSGTVDVLLGSEVIATLGPGDHVGEMALLDGKPRNASVVATTEVHALLVASREFRALVGQVPNLDRRLLTSLTERLRSSQTARPVTIDLR